jgi:hypothetical protein
MRYHLAARYARRVELCGYREQLLSIGDTVTSRWLDFRKMPSTRLDDTQWQSSRLESTTVWILLYWLLSQEIKSFGPGSGAESIVLQKSGCRGHDI